MYKLKDVIASGGKNPKINKALDRYELSKEEKKDIVNEVKNISGSGGSVSGGSNIEYLDIRNITDSDLMEAIVIFTLALRIGSGDNQTIGGSTLILSISKGQVNWADVSFIAIDNKNPFIIINEGQKQESRLFTVLETVGLVDAYNAIPRVTEEQFYDPDFI